MTQRAALGQLFALLQRHAVVAEFGNEAEAKAWIADHPGGWDLAVIDLILEQGTGMRLIADCRSASPHATLVVLSNYVTPGIRAHCSKLGAHAVFQKGAEFEAFAAFCAGFDAATSRQIS